MYTINSNVRSFLSFMGAAVPVSCGWAWYKTTDKVEQFVRIQESFAVLAGARIGYEFVKKGRYLTAAIVSVVSTFAIKSALERSSIRTVRAFLASVAVIAIGMEWLTKDQGKITVSHPPDPNDPEVIAAHELLDDHLERVRARELAEEDPAGIPPRPICCPPSDQERPAY